MFAGVALQGATLRSDSDTDADMYGHAIDRKAALNGQVPVPAAAPPLIETLTRYLRRRTLSSPRRQSPPWNRPKARAAISDMASKPAPSASACEVLRRLKSKPADQQVADRQVEHAPQNIDGRQG